MVVNQSLLGRNALTSSCWITHLEQTVEQTVAQTMEQTVAQMQNRPWNRPPPPSVQYIKQRLHEIGHLFMSQEQVHPEELPNDILLPDNCTIYKHNKCITQFINYPPKTSDDISRSLKGDMQYCTYIYRNKNRFRKNLENWVFLRIGYLTLDDSVTQLPVFF